MRAVVPTQLDHLIVKVNDIATSVGFYRRMLGLTDEGTLGPFSVLRVNDGLTLQLAAWGTSGGEHLAFAMTRAEFDDAFARVRESGIEYGDSFRSIGSQRGPGQEQGSRGIGEALYFFDPDKHLIEIRHYEI
jgi:catechol 2,3-dioxygenase-like lactoylglutathione lyase family enzyme